ncbi:hypothetical protein NADFUDRAFT_47492 [Nadsonia fulvescens var. elongata DSM 6958]|uniref:BZIP domain-containing protein n=1 Tax=Nadsonia fulvescens var. elongata DSM 6958 TaxID=857566 RepID=A0A1E3PFY7_9ASCO|nr:hypothetical protein NADFUDRAFT_47492 [Nadsonia fulvescens var. elongata DSM 6958]
MSTNSFNLGNSDDSQIISLNIWDKPSFVTTSTLPRPPPSEAADGTVTSGDKVKHTEKRKPAATQSSIQEEDTLTHKVVKPSAPEERRKPGRKLDQKEPANKRKAQNRAAQRAFRERKERHLIELEEKVESLEQETTVTHNENEFLRFQVKRLQNELKMYREKTKQTGFSSIIPTSEPGSNLDSSLRKSSSASIENLPNDGLSSNPAFTFEFPFYNNESSATDGNNFNKSSDSSNSSSSAKPSPFSEYSNDSYDKAGILSTSSSLTGPEDADEEREFCYELSQACGTKNQHSLSKASLSSSFSGDDKKPSFTETSQPYAEESSITAPDMSLLDELTKSATDPIPATANSFLGDGFDNNHNLNSTLFDFDNLDGIDFSLYRDQVFDTEDFTLPELISEDNKNQSSGTDLFGQLEDSGKDLFENINSVPSTTASDSFLDTTPKDLVINTEEPIGSEFDHNESDLIVPSTNKDLLNCAAVWDRITHHPKYHDIDIDGLCVELKQKAKCSEFGIVLAEKDLDNSLFG